jgi:hypothetical protein
VFQPQVALRQAVLLIGLFLVVVTNIEAQNNDKPWLRGAWEGTGYQTDDNTTWAMKVTVKRLKGGRRAFLIDYPSLNCGGRWKLLSMNQSKARFREVLDHGQDQCSDKGLVTIERIGRQLIFLYANQGSREITASAVLNRKMPVATQ